MTQESSVTELLKTIENNQSINGLIQSSPICHKIFDSDFRMLFMSNAGVCALKIPNVEDLYGKVFPPDSAPEETREIIHEHMHRATKGETSTAEYHFMVDGNTIWYRTTFSPFYAPEGQLMYLRADSMDITSMKMAEKDMLAAKDEAEKANAAKSEFLSRMSHELRTPLNAILGFSQLLETDRREPLTPSQEGRVNEIKKGGSHLLELINEVLDLSRIEAGKLTLSIENLDILSVIEETLTLVLPLAEKHYISIENRIQNPVYVKADRTKLKQAILNLLSNAIKYNIQNGSVVLDSRLNSENKVCISVKDTGKGLSSSELDQIFEPFNRLDADQTQVEGTGIGLTITRRLMELMDGSVHVESKEGTGSTFTLLLPQGNAADILINPVDLVSQPITSSSIDQHVILYIEDNPANLTLVEEILKHRKDIRLLSAPQAIMGIDLARSHGPDLILMDINLPEMDGFEALRRLNAYEETKNIPVLAVSANAMESDVLRALKAGFKSYIKKPFDLQFFIQEIDKFLIQEEISAQ